MISVVGTDAHLRLADPTVQTAVEAIHYAVEELRSRRSLSAWTQVGEDRFNKDEINRQGVRPNRVPFTGKEFWVDTAQRQGRSIQPGC